MREAMLKLLYTIPTPFYDARYTPESQHEISILLELAKQNKVELLLLESLDKTMSLPFSFKKRLMELRKKRTEMAITSYRIIDLLEKLGYKAATFKTWTPFPAVPNDTDVVILDDIDVKEFKLLVQELANKHSYQIFDAIPYAVSIHDQRCSKHLNPKIKDPCDVDLYFEIAANRIIYLNKRLLERHLRDVSIDHEVIQLYMLSNEHELLTQLIHCFLPEQIFLLYHYYIFLYFLDKINLQYFLETAKKAHANYIIVFPLSITLDILNIMRSHGRSNGIHKVLVDEFLNKGYYRFKIQEIVLTIMDKARKESLFRKSLMIQFASLINIKNFHHVISQIMTRRTRITY
ncbi:MAG: hypothetical protein QXW86_09400 [Saccharolobus sp.]|uniref:hypothetical protein n=1 Tax=Saccharolobus sp. TaxID=2100761 RepID=UPI0031721C4A